MGSSRPGLLPDALTALERLQVPLRSLEEACRSCREEAGDEEESCDDVEGYPKGFDVDLDSEMLGSVNQYSRQILISTGKSDWEREVTDDHRSLAGIVKEVYETNLKKQIRQNKNKLKAGETSAEPGTTTSPVEDSIQYKGVYSSSVVDTNHTLSTPTEPSAARLSILTSSFQSPSSSEELDHSVIVLPDYKIIHHVSPNSTAAKDLVDSHLLPSVPRIGTYVAGDTLDEIETRSYPLPYRALILICSHKKRDKRCHIAAPLLINQFHVQLDKHEIEVDERGDDLGQLETDVPLEEYAGDLERRRRVMEESLRGVRKEGEGGRVGVFKCSHIGGHRYAGNVIIYLPNGTSIWYGRVTPKDVAAIVQTTLIEGKVIPELLRGGLGITNKRDGPGGVLDW